jgi:hypothetical protein
MVCIRITPPAVRIASDSFSTVFLSMMLMVLYTMVVLRRFINASSWASNSSGLLGAKSPGVSRAMSVVSVKSSPSGKVALSLATQGRITYIITSSVWGFTVSPLGGAVERVCRACNE